MNMFNFNHGSGRRFAASLLCAIAAIAFFPGMAGTAHAETDVSYGRLITTRAVAVNLWTHKVYAVDESAGRVVVTDEQTGATRTVSVGMGPIALAVNPRTNRIYVVNESSSSVSVIDGQQDAVIATIQIRAGSNPYVVAADPSTNKIYVTNTYSDALIVIDGATNSVTHLKTGSADGIVIDSHSNTIFLMTYEDPVIRIVNASTGAMTKVNVGAHLWGMTFDRARRTLYLGHTGANNIVALDVQTHAIHTIQAGQIPCAVAVNPRTQMLYAVNYGSQTVSVINLKSNKVVATLPVGSHPQDVKVDAVHNRIYVANVHSNSITAINGATNTVIGTYPAGKNPYALAVDPETQKVSVANYDEPVVTVINVARAKAH